MRVLAILTNNPMIIIIDEEIAVRTDALTQDPEYMGVLLVLELTDALGLHTLPHV